MNRILKKCNKTIVTSKHTYYTSRGKCGDMFTIVQVSDLQSEYFGEKQKDLLDAVSACGPDMIVITGDLVDRSHTDFLAAERAVNGFLKLAPVYYVNGNHEADLVGDEAADLYKSLEKRGVHVLMDRNEIAEFGGIRVNIAGLSEYTMFQARRQRAGSGHRTRKHGFAIPKVVRQIREAFGDRKAYRGEEAGALRILLAHEPQYLRYYSAGHPELIFSGHAHGGQFCLPGGRGLFAPDQGILPALTSGCHRFGASTMYISRGLGNSSFPLRLNNPPEILCVQVVGTAD